MAGRGKDFAIDGESMAVAEGGSMAEMARGFRFTEELELEALYSCSLDHSSERQQVISVMESPKGR